MIDFNNKAFIKLSHSDDFGNKVQDLLMDGEIVVDSFRTMRDGIVFTNSRIIAVNVKGIFGKKVDYTSIPYKKISVFSAKTADVIDLDSEIKVFIPGVGSKTFEFTPSTDVKEISKYIAIGCFGVEEKLNDRI